MPTDDSICIYRYAQLKALGIDFTPQHLGRLERVGLFPRRVKLNPRGPKNGSVGWRSDEVREYLRRLAPRAEVKA